MFPFASRSAAEACRRHSAFGKLALSEKKRRLSFFFIAWAKDSEGVQAQNFVCMEASQRDGSGS